MAVFRWLGLLFLFAIPFAAPCFPKTSYGIYDCILGDLRFDFPRCEMIMLIRSVNVIANAIALHTYCRINTEHVTLIRGNMRFSSGVCWEKFYSFRMPYETKMNAIP